jgi:molybdate transport system substrate-binding protein
MLSAMNRRLFNLALAALAALALSLPASAQEVHVMISGGFQAAYRTLGPEFERLTGFKLVTVAGPSMGETPQAIPNRIDRGEPVDVVIMVGEALGELAKRGKVNPDSRKDLARSPIAMAVRTGEPKPDISTVDALKRALLDAKSIAYSDSASGMYLEKELFPRLGIAEQLRGKARAIPAEPVAKVVARGDAQIGFQQLSELKPVPGIDIVGLLPEGAQKITMFSAGISTTAKEQQGAYALVKFLSSDFSRQAIIDTGLDPVAKGKEAY